MRRFILMIGIAGIIAPAGLNAQKVYIEDGKAVLDLTVAAGMPAGAVTATSKTTYYDGFSPSNTTMGTISGVNNNQDHPINATVFEKLEIDKTDVVTSDWASAFNACKDLDKDGKTDWRLPTYRELMLMYIFRPALDNILGTLGGTAFADLSYWSATERTDANAWRIFFLNGTASYYGKTNTNRGRCVREIN